MKSATARRRKYGVGIVRILFGIALVIDAGFKWSPSFSDHFLSYLTNAAKGQPEYAKAWITFWIEIVRVNPPLFAHIVATAETLVAAGIVLGAFSAIVDLAGALLMLVIWSTAEGFGGPYKAGSTDIGAGVIYVVLFAALFFARAGLYLGLDGIMRRRALPPATRRAAAPQRVSYSRAGDQSTRP
jgi:thiosulfate dehydrogenase (quinone) large subunit